MFVTRKEYDLGGDNKAPGYELFDDYNVRAQLTPTQAQELFLWLADRADQIDKDITGETSLETLEEIASRWKAEAKKEPPFYPVGETEDEEFARISRDDPPDEDDPWINP